MFLPKRKRRPARLRSRATEPVYTRRHAFSRCSPVLVAIVGGSGSGKSWLAQRLKTSLGRRTLRVSLDDFYLDRSHLSPARRARVNFDQPGAVDWPSFERAMQDLSAGRPTVLPCYDFRTHCRQKRGRVLRPKPVILVEGLWLLRRRGLRPRFALSVFLDCPARLRLHRRLERDTKSRGRTPVSVLHQFRRHVEPMHRQYVAPQARWADLVLPGTCSPALVRDLRARILALL